MRIISGKLKGKSINFLKNSITRPLKDSVKENIFNILKHSNYINLKIENSNILDLYSGIGSFGIECISRGADKVTFIDKDINAIKTLKKNLNKYSINNQSKVLNQTIDDNLIGTLKEKFKIFFLDPPYRDLNFLRNIQLLKKHRLFEAEHLVIIHREKKVIDNFEGILKIIKIKIYGRSKIIFGSFN